MATNRSLSKKEESAVYDAVNKRRKAIAEGKGTYAYEQADSVQASPAGPVNISDHGLSAVQQLARESVERRQQERKNSVQKQKASVKLPESNVLKSAVQSEGMSKFANKKKDGKIGLDVSRINELPKSKVSNPSKDTISIEPQVRLGRFSANEPAGFETVTAYDKARFYDRQRSANKLDAMLDSEKAKLFAERHPVIGAAASVAAGFGGSVLTPIGTLAQKVNNPKGSIDENAPIFQMSRTAQALREGTKSGIKQDFGIDDYKADGSRTFASQAIDFGVDTGLSMVETVVRSFANPVGGAAQAGLSAASQAFLDAKDNGADDTHAVAQGIAQGVAEDFFEKFSLEGLKAFKTAPTDSITAMAKNIAKQSFVEGSEEFATDWANAITDYMIMGGDSQWQQDYNALIQNGSDEASAVKGATVNVLNQSLLSFLGGAISGGILGGGAQAFNYKANRTTGRSLSEQNQNFTADELKQTADAIHDTADEFKSDEAFEQAQSAKEYLTQLAEKAESGKQLSETEQGAALNEIMATTQGGKGDLILEKGTDTVDEPINIDEYIDNIVKNKKQGLSVANKQEPDVSDFAGPEEYAPESKIGKSATVSYTNDADFYADKRTELSRRADTRFSNNEDAKKIYTGFYHGQNIVDYDESMSKAYEAGRKGSSLSSLAEDKSFTDYYKSNPNSIDAIWRQGYKSYEEANHSENAENASDNSSVFNTGDSVTYNGRKYTVEGIVGKKQNNVRLTDDKTGSKRTVPISELTKGGNDNGRAVDELSDGGRVQESEQVRTESDRGNGGVRTVENSGYEGGRNVSGVSSERSGDNDEQVHDSDRSGTSGGRSGRVSEGDQVSDNGQRSGRGGVTEESPAQQAAREAVEAKEKKEATKKEVSQKTEKTSKTAEKQPKATKKTDEKVQNVQKNELKVGSDVEYNGTQYTVEELNGDKVLLKEKDSESPLFPNGKHAEVFRSDIESSKPSEQTVKKASKETAKKQAKQKDDIAAQDEPKGSNYVISPDSNDIPTTEGSRYKANVDAIKTLQNIISENRTATSEEQSILAKFTGWGGISDAKLKGSEEELRSILSDDEYNSAMRSTLDAYYTDPKLIRGIYTGLQSIGFNGGRVLEPSAGVGRFIGSMPADISQKVKSVTAVELDKITGNIAKNLYPQADVRVQGFEKAKLANGYMDLVVGNVPFGDSGVSDIRYPKNVTARIHNYFIARSLDTLREGGVACLITSSGTLESQTNDARQYFMKKADLIGAIRLPNNAFGDTGTNVVTDILVFKKRADGTPYGGESFLNKKYLRDAGNVNEYFANHPEMILGTPAWTTGRYGGGITYQAKEGTDLETQVSEAFKNIGYKMEYPKVDNREVQKQSNKEARNKKVGTAYKKDGKLFINNQGLEQELDVSAKEEAIYSNMVDIRDTARELINAMSMGDSNVDSLRKRLNEQYDSFREVYKNGFHDTRVKNVIKNDTDYAFMQALERVKDKKVVKADIFTKNTINPVVNITSVDTLDEGVDVSLSEVGYIDTDRISELMHTTKKDVEARLLNSELAYKDANGNFISSDEYLSGNVRAKYYEAEMLAENDKSYQRNVDALKKVLPEWVKGSDVRVNVGVTWIPPEYYAQFMDDLLEVPRGNFRVNYNPSIGYQIEKTGYSSLYGPNNTKVWGTNAMPFYNSGIKNPGLFANILNSKDLVVKYTDKNGKSVIDQASTEELRALKNKIDQKFNEWLWKDADRTAMLEKVYNDSFNCLVRPKYSENVSIAGQSAEIKLRAHQGRAVNRIVRSPYNTLLQHGVGAGKTFAAISSVMKLRQLGVAKKPVIVVPKNKIGDWRDDFYKIYPAAKVLVADDTTFSAGNRKIFTNKIATTDIDAVIVSKEQFQKIPMSEEAQQTFEQNELDSLEAAIKEFSATNGAHSITVRQLQSKLEKAKKRLTDLKENTKRDNDNISFEETGIDYVFVDEAQSYKNLAPTTQRSNVAGMGSSEKSQIANDMLMKADYLRGIQNGKGLVFCTATPIMNTPVEAYTMFRFLANEELEKRGIRNLDNFIDMFGRIEARTQQDAAGREWVIRNAFTGFDNMQEWQQLWGMIADVVKTQDVPGIVLPQMRGGKRITVVSEATAKSKEVIAGLGERLKRNAKEGEDHVFKIQNDGKKASITQRYFDSSLPYGENEKIPKAADKIYEEYKNSTTFTDRNGNKQKNGTQLVFLEWGAPDNVKEGEPPLYQDLKNMLIAKGIPEDEIAFVHDAKTDKAKDELYEKVRAGKTRVLIGSSKKMGEGLNIQDRVVALHELMPLPRPGDIEQVEGRAIRQGNLNSEVAIYVYVTEGTFDTKQWNDLYNKSKFINEITSGEFKGRGVAMDFSDEGGFSASAADIMAISSGNPLLKEQVENADKLRKLENLETAHRRKVFNAREEANRAQKRVESNKEALPKYEADAKKVRDLSGDNFVGRINKKTLTKRKEFGEEVIAASKKAIGSGNSEYVKVGKISEFDLYVSGKVPKIELRGERSYDAEVNLNSPEGTTTRILNVLAAVKEKPASVKAMIKTDEANIPKLIEVSESKFEQASELEATREKAKSLEAQLLMSKDISASQETDSETGEVFERRQKRKSVKHEIMETLEISRTEKNNNYSKVVLEERVNSKLASDIQDLTGVNVDGWQVDFPIESFRHIEKRHGINGVADHSMSQVGDYQRVADIIDSYTNIKSGNRSSEFRNSNGSSAQTVELSMELKNDEFLTIMAVPDSKKHTIHVVSAYKSEKRSSLSGAGIQKNPQRYVQDGPELTTSTDNVTLERKKGKKLELNPEDWQTTRTAGNKSEVKSLQEIVARIEHDYGINITTGHIRGDAMGNFNVRDQGIKTKVNNDLPTIAHEFGHWLDNKLDLVNADLDDDVVADLEKALGDEGKATYSKKLWRKEGLAEFMRAFLKNKDTASIDYPNATKYLLGSLSPKESIELTAIANDINAYFAADPRTKGAPVLKEKSKIDLRTPSEKLRDTSDHWYQLVVDSNHSFRRFDRATGGNTYMYASNAAYSDARVNAILENDLRDMEGNYVGPSLKTVLKDIHMTEGLRGKPTQEYTDFGEYLVMRHGIEFLRQGKRVFANDSMNSETYMAGRAAELEKQYPMFKPTAERIYDWIDTFTMTYAVKEGLISLDAYKAMKEAYQCYVPFFRAGFEKRGNSLARAKGSGRPIINPVDNIVDMVVKTVNTATRNNTLRHMRDDAINFGANAKFIEKVPAPMGRKEFDLRGIKQELSNESYLALDEYGADPKLMDAMQGLIDNISDTLVQYELGKPSKDGVIQILVDGQKEFWKINDPELLDSIVNMNMRVQSPILKTYAKATRFMTSNITGRNVVWSIGSNAVRDFETFLVYADNESRKKFASGLASNFANSLKAELGMDTSGLYSEFVSMGGGGAGVWQGSDSFTPEMRKNLSSEKRVSLNPFHWITWLSDTIEMGPRFATYKALRENGATPQEAFYQAMDVTVNFRRHGIVSKEANTLVQFFNASMQGVDKSVRFFTAEDMIGKGNKARGRAVFQRVAMMTAVSAAVAVLQHILKEKDEETKEAYSMLSNYTKNSYFVIPIGNGKFAAIAKPRELGTPTSLMSRIAERVLDDNTHAFDEFYSYWATNSLPSIVSDIAQFPENVYEEGLQGAIDELSAGAIGSMGVIGILSNVQANRDFLGRPIESNVYKATMSKDRYNAKTSEMAYLIGQALNLSPQKLDYFGENFLGVFWKVPEALFPIDDGKGVKGERDLTLGLGNTYVKDSLYSQDLVNWLYDEKEKSEMLKNHDEEDIDSAIVYNQESTLATYYSNFNKLNKVNYTNSQRISRRQVLETIGAYKASKEKGVYPSEELATAVEIAKETHDTSVLPSAMSVEIKDADGNVYQLTDIQYVEYQNKYNAYYYEYMHYLNLNKKLGSQATAMKKVKAYAKDQATNDMLKKLGKKGEKKKITVKQAIKESYK